MSEVNKPQPKKKLVSRREFLIGGGAAILLSALNACAPKTVVETATTTATETKTVTNVTTKTATTTVFSSPNESTAVITSPSPTQSSPITGAEIVWDTWGVPHIFAESDEDAMFALGYATAKSRLIQMELSRKIIQGRLAELIGYVKTNTNEGSSLDSDIYMRTIGFYRHAQKIVTVLGEEERKFLQAYSDGVNKFLDENPTHFQQIVPNLIHKPEPWKSEDTIACWIHLANFFTANGLNDSNPLQEPASTNPVDDSAAVVKRGDVDEEWVNKVTDFAGKHGYHTEQIESSSIPGPSFSHAWVVGGNRTTTGAAVLVSDPQTPVTLPNLFFEFHVKGGTFDTRGIGAPGSPIMLIGWNRDVAWGMTALGGDQADLFKLTLDRQHVDQYLWDGEWKPMNVWTESVLVRDDDPVTLTIKETHLGPIVTDFLRGTITTGACVLHRVPQVLDKTDTVEAGIAMMRSKSVEEFDTALGKWSYPPVNVVFCDKDGDIGYHMTGASPVRATNPNTSGNRYQDGSNSAGEWQGFIPHELQPRVFNPAQGWLASANHRPIESWYPMQQSGSGSSGHTVRSWRLYELLQAHNNEFSPAEVFAIHYDNVDPARYTIVRAAIYLTDIQMIDLTPETEKAIDLLRAWLDRGTHCDTSDPAYPLVYHINTSFRPNSSRQTSLADYGGGESGLVRFCKALRFAIEANGSIDNDSIAYIENAIMQGWNTCLTKYGDNPSLWLERFRNSQSVRNLEYMVGLDNFPGLNSEISIDYPILSDLTTSTIFSQGSQSYTQFIALDDVDSAMSLMPVGNSEIPRSPFYKVNLDAWAKGVLHPAPLSKNAVAAYQVDIEIVSRTE